MESARVPSALELGGDGHYLNVLAACAAKRPLTVCRAVYSARGARLLEPGTSIDRDSLALLAGQTLGEPIDACLTAEDAVTSRAVMELARSLVDGVPLLAHFESVLGDDAKRLWLALESVPLPPSAALRLTVAREAAGNVYEHAVRAAFLAAFLGLSVRMTDAELHVLAQAALLHDVGMMHLDPALSDERRSMSALDRRQVQTHPLLGCQVAFGEPALDPAVANAIAQHHERLDGSGYPYALSGGRISKPARVLMLVEIVSAVLDTGDAAQALQLSMILRVNRDSLDPEISRVLLAALPRAAPLGNDAASRADLKRAGALLAAWRNMASPPAAQSPTYAFVSERMEKLQRIVAEADLSSSPDIDDPDATSIVCAEMESLGREALWHARQIAYDVLQRWPDAGLGETPRGRDALGEWLSATLRLTHPHRDTVIG